MDDKFKQLKLIERELNYLNRDAVSFCINRGGMSKAREYYKKLKNKRLELMNGLMFK